MECAACDGALPRSAFSGNQARKPSSERRCKACVFASAAAAGASKPASMSRQLREQAAALAAPTMELVDIGINLTNRQFKRDWEAVVRRARAAGVVSMLLTGTSVKESRAALGLAQAWYDADGAAAPLLRTTVGIHPHDASTFDASGASLREMRAMLSDPLACAVGECGLDYNRMHSPKAAQLAAFRAQVELACELDLPVFVHEREAHDDLIAVLDSVAAAAAAAAAPRAASAARRSEGLPPIVVHCFTGTLAEARAYIDRGFYIGFTGTICKQQRGAPLRAILPHLPLARLMVETDAPFMGFVKGRRRSEPADVVGVAEAMADAMGLEHAAVAAATTANARAFFRL